MGILLTPQTVDSLRKIAGDRHVIEAREELEPYSRDEAVGPSYPDVVVRPKTVQEVRSIVTLAADRGIPLTPRGAGTGLTGGAVPVRGGVVLSLERMDGIVEIDEQNLVAVMEPGVIVGALHRAVEAAGLFYPPDPASLDSCTIGGNIAENAGGPRAAKYGITRHYVLGLEVVLPSGQVVQYGGKMIKNTAGYDLPHIFVGSEGTLGIITRAILRLVPLPEHRIDLLVPFPVLENSARAVTEILRRRKVVPAAVELMDRAAVAASAAHLQKELPFPEAEAQLLIQLDGNDMNALEAQCDQVGEICFEQGAEDVLVATNRPAQERMWEGRRAVLEAVKTASQAVRFEDVSVPRACITDFLRRLAEISRETRVPVVSWGHAADGNIHIGMMKMDMGEDAWSHQVGETVQRILATALALGGTISGEHGIGCLKRDCLTKAVGPAERRLMWDLKKVLDPREILNPGKVLPDEC